MSNVSNVLEMEATLRKDPVKWARWKLKDQKGNPWQARWYQIDLINDVVSGKTNKLAVRMGRRVGKTETMCVYMLWHAFHKKNQRLLVATPYENQVRLIFKRLKELISTSKELSDSLIKDTSNPYELGFSNGTAIIGFTVGATSGAGASVRGQRADFLFIDEIDYISQDGIDATIAISHEDPRNIGIWASSTPTGKRSFFYKICTNRSTGYTAYHYPSMVNPNFDIAMETEFRSTMTEQGYVHEVLAEFGEETMGVFGKRFVEAARDEFLYSYYSLNEYQIGLAKEDGYDIDKIVFMAEYTQKNLPPSAKRILGVDWDKYANATQIVSTVYDTHLNKFRVEGRWEIPRSEFTFDNAVKKIIELNDIFDYDAIYVDAGSGEMQIEQLRLHGKENPETGLYKKVKRIQFKMSIEVTDPVTGGIDKKNAKHFMVNQTSMLLERGRIAISAFDDMIWKQMMGYSVVKFSASGDPIYTSEDEHALDAFMLTILGFAQQYPEITQTMVKQQNSTNFGSIAMASGDVEGAIYGGTSDIYGGGSRSWRKTDEGSWGKIPTARKKGNKLSMARRGGGRSKGSGRTMF
ncbi:hypothetical protein C0431_13175 [bacterium]|nr:hypothetical protein [bacterium]